jgi:hypothetical protein
LKNIYNKPNTEFLKTLVLAIILTITTLPEIASKREFLSQIAELFFGLLKAESIDIRILAIHSARTLILQSASEDESIRRAGIKFIRILLPILTYCFISIPISNNEEIDHSLDEELLKLYVIFSRSSTDEQISNIFLIVRV